MAQQRRVVRVDDLTGEEADETIVFRVDGTTYELDLSAHNAARFREAIREWTAPARRVGHAQARPGQAR